MAAPKRKGEPVEIIVVASVLTFVIVALLAFCGWQAQAHQRSIDTLTNKIMAQTFTEYANHAPQLADVDQVEREAPKKRAVNDPVLGNIY